MAFARIFASSRSKWRGEGCSSSRLPCLRDDPVRDVVKRGVFHRRYDRQLVNIQTQHVRRAQSSAPQSPGYRIRSPDPAHRHRGPIGIRSSSAIRQSCVVGCVPVPNAMPGSITSTISSGRGSASSSPRRADIQPLAQSQRVIVFFPGFGPVFVVHDVKSSAPAWDKVYP